MWRVDISETLSEVSQVQRCGEDNPPSNFVRRVFKLSLQLDVAD